MKRRYEVGNKLIKGIGNGNRQQVEKGEEECNGEYKQKLMENRRN
jgi:hypothetical protein